MDKIHIFGIRHHGPGSARSLRSALEALQPDALLIEGPPDANELLPLFAHRELVPPVALLVYAVDMPHLSAFYPFARFSPEYQAIRYALQQGVPVQFMDLPFYHQLAQGTGGQEAEGQEAGGGRQETDTVDEQQETDSDPSSRLLPPVIDPIGALAKAAGYSDGERWWEKMVEQRRDQHELFEAIREAMAALREDQAYLDPNEALREAWMRQTIRAALKAGHQRIAVVCGAWHAPALRDLAEAKADERLLKGLPKIKTAATLTPWTYGRLSYRSGYGAGVAAPGWYDHLWEMGERSASSSLITTHWMAKVGQLLRQEDLDASAAHVIEAVRLAEALAAFRGHPLPGLHELDEACQAIFCFGGDGPMALIRERLTINERLGEVPAEVPAVPLQQDLQREQRRLRLKAEASWRDLKLDLREPVAREQSALLRRLNLLGIAWGQLGERSGKGTFREIWRIQWEPEFSIQLIEAAIWGVTVESAAAAKALHAVNHAESLPALVGVVNQVLLADLPGAVDALMSQLQARSAQSSDIGELMDALTVEDRQTRTSLVGSALYGNVRQTDSSLVRQVIDGMVTRICVGLVNACIGLNDDAAEAMFKRIVAVDGVLGLLGQPEQGRQWHAALRRIADTQGINGLLAGRACRILFDAGVCTAEELGQRLSLALSKASDPASAAGWIEGLLRDNSGLLLLNDTRLWSILDSWLIALNVDIFQAILPLLRRTFSTFAAGERRQLGERARRGNIPGVPSQVYEQEPDFDPARAATVLPLIAQIYGIRNAYDQQ
jgi:hypothetical protein